MKNFTSNSDLSKQLSDNLVTFSEDDTHLSINGVVFELDFSNGVQLVYMSPLEDETITIYPNSVSFDSIG